jgi:hypothetical protein
LGGLSGSQPIGFANTFYSPLGRSAGHGRRSRGRQPSFRRPSAREGFSWAREFDNLQPGDETRIRAVLAEQQKTVGSGLSMVDASRFPPICSDKPHIDDSRSLRLLSTPLGQAKSILAVTSAVGSHWTPASGGPAAGRPLPGQAFSLGDATQTRAQQPAAGVLGDPPDQMSTRDDVGFDSKPLPSDPSLERGRE